MEYTIGTAVFNDWIITEKIGQGASGQVYKIKKNGSEEIYSALKVIRIPQSPFEIQAVMSEGMTEDEATDYFKGYIDEICSEIKIMSSLKEHPNIVTYESHSVMPHRNEIGWDILIKMELLTPLLNWQMRHPLDENDIIRLGYEISSALTYVADYNLIHRDIKPENIFVDASGKFKSGDFGIARTLEKTTGGLSRKGTDSYMAPEVYLGKNYNAQADIYSLGIVMYRFLNDNRLPFYPPKTETFTYSDREAALMKRIQGLPLPEPATGSEELKAIVLKACEYLPENRYESMSGFHNALQKLNKGGGDGPGGEDPPPPPPKWPKLVLVGVLLFTFAGLFFAVMHLNAKTRENQLTVAALYGGDTDCVVYSTDEFENATESDETEEQRAELSEYLNCTVDEIKEVFGEPIREGWSMCVNYFIYDDYRFESMYSENNEEMISRICLRNNSTKYELCGVRVQMSEEEAESQLLENGFYKLETGVFYNGVDRFVTLEQDSVYEENAEGGGDWKELETLSIDASVLRESLHPDKTEVFQYMKCSIDKAVSDIPNLSVYEKDDQTVVAEKDGIRFEAEKNGEDLQQAVIQRIVIIGEESEYCLYGITPEDSENAGDYLAFGEGGSGERIDPAGSVLYLWDKQDEKRAISLTTR